MDFSQQKVIAATGMIKGLREPYKKMVDFVHLVRFAKLEAASQNKTLEYRTIISTAPVIAGIVVEDEQILLYAGIVQMANLWHKSLFPVKFVHELMTADILENGYSDKHQVLDQLNAQIIELYYQAQTKYRFDYFSQESGEASVINRCLAKLGYWHSGPLIGTHEAEISVADIRYAVYFQFGLTVTVKPFCEDKIPVQKIKLGENIVLGQNIKIGNECLYKPAGISIQIDCSHHEMFRNVVTKLEKVGRFIFDLIGKRLTVMVEIKIKASACQPIELAHKTSPLAQGCILGNPKDDLTVSRQKTWFAGATTRDCSAV